MRPAHCASTLLASNGNVRQRHSLHPAGHHAARCWRLLGVAALVALQITLIRVQPALAAPGDLVADVLAVASYPQSVAPSIAFDGHYLYHTGYGDSVLHRLNVPPAGGASTATGEYDVTIQGAATGIMTLSYDSGRDAFWAVSGDGLSIYLLTKSGLASLAFTIDPATDRPGFQPVGDYPNEIKIAYDAADDTIWYSSDAGVRIYHYHTFADGSGTADLVAGTPYIDIDVAPNNMDPQCGYSQSSGVAVGGAHLFITAAGCPYYFEYTKTGGKVAVYPYNRYDSPTSAEDLECDDVSYAVPVFWVRDAFDGHIRAFEQPPGTPCVYGGGPRPTARLALAIAATGPTAGAGFTFTVVAQDRFGSLTPRYGGTVHFTSTDASSGVILPPDSSLSGGQGTFSATLIKAGPQTITATDAANASVTGSLTVTVQAASAAGLILRTPASAKPGQAFAASVTLNDRFGNLATGYTGTVHFTSSDPLATLPADYTFNAADGGVHGFSVTLMTPTIPTLPGQTITVTDTANASLGATSPPVNVSPL